jgi:hypothetical protein
MAQRPLAPGCISTDSLCGLTELTSRRLRQLAEAGYFPPPVMGQYQLTPTIAGLFRYHREQLHKKDDTEAAARKRKLNLSGDKIEEELSILRRQYIKAGDIGPGLRNLSIQQRAVLQRKLETELAPRIANLSYEKIRPLMSAVIDELCDIMRAGTEGWLFTIDDLRLTSQDEPPTRQSKIVNRKSTPKKKGAGQ